VPAPDGVKRPVDVTVPPVAVQVTAVLNVPVPSTVAAHCDVCPVLMEDGDAVTEMEVIVNGTLVTVMEAVPEILVYPACVDVALQVPVPAPEGVNTPPGVMVPPVAVHATALLNAPVPVTFATHVEVCAVVIEDGFAATAIPVTVAGALVTEIAAVPVILAKPACVDFAVQLAVPRPDGVKTPPCVMVPPVADHVTPLLYAPVPLTVATHVEVCAVVIEDGFAATAMLVTVGVTLVTAIGAVPDIFVKPACVDVAVHVPVPVPDGVKTPPCVIVPPVAVHTTPVL
jgi:hypothetical protein